MVRAEQIAMVAHEVNRAYCQTLGDYSQPVWEQAPEWQRESLLSGVRLIEAGVVQCPEDSHRSWLDHKVREGWTWGRLKDPGAKTHPNMVPWSALDERERVKDALFFACVMTLLSVKE